MERDQLVPMDIPATYRICVTGCLESEMAERLWGMTSIPIEKIGEYIGFESLTTHINRDVA